MSSSARTRRPRWGRRCGTTRSCPRFTRGRSSASKVENKNEIIGKEFDPKKLVSFIYNDKHTLPEQRRELDLLEKLDRMRAEQQQIKDPQLDAAIQSMEVAYRMQTEAPDVFDIRKETPGNAGAIWARQHRPWLPDGGAAGAARRPDGPGLLRRGRSVGSPRQHPDHRKTSFDSDRPFAAVVKDLKSRGLFKDTIVVCGSEFGRTPVCEVGAGGEGAANGRDHNPFAFTMWLAGGGIKGGTVYGTTDDFGFKVVDKPVHVHDIHATILHLLGIDHTKLTYRYSGRDFRLTDVAGQGDYRHPRVKRHVAYELCGLLRATRAPKARQVPAPRPTRGKTRFRCVPHDGGSGSGSPEAGKGSVGRTAIHPRQWRISASADGNTCSAFFDLTQRAGRIAPGA